MATISTQKLEEQFNAVYGTARIVKRGTFPIDLNEFYFLYMLTPFENGLQLCQKQFAYFKVNRVLNIDAYSIETEVFH